MNYDLDWRWAIITCEHREIIMVNSRGIKLESGGYEVDFSIECCDCRKELFRISEYKRKIHNLSKHAL